MKSLHDQLHITAAQEQNWQGFASVMKSNMEASAAAMATRQQKFDNMNAVEDLQSFADMTGQEAERLSRLVGPLQTLYGPVVARSEAFGPTGSSATSALAAAARTADLRRGSRAVLDGTHASR